MLYTPRPLAGLAATFALAFAAVPASAAPPNVFDPSSYAYANGFGANVTQVQTEIRNGVVGNTYDQTGGSARATSTFDNGWDNSASIVSNIGVTAVASASLRDGTARASVTNGSVNTPRGFAEARIQDTVFFNNTSGATVYVPFSFQFDGSLVNAPNGGGSAIFKFDNARTCTDLSYSSCGNSLRLQNGANANNTTVIGYLGDGSQNGVQQGGAFFFGAPDNVDLANYTVSKDWNTTLGYYDTRVSSVLAVPVGASRLGFDLRLVVDCFVGLNAVCDFGHTSAFGFGDLPTGLSFTSGSGVFLAGNPSVGGVPEPASWAMLIAGFGLVGAVMRKRRVAVVAA